MNGKCLCGQIEFEIAAPLTNIYQCHCSLCRKVTGSSSNAALLIPETQFRWVRGAEYIASFVSDSGYRSDFCSRCGSPVPNPLRGKPLWWVPVGLLEGDSNIEIAAHIHVASKAPWDVIPDKGVQFEDAPEFECLLEALGSR